jgi:UDP-N-acetylglucosamine diphosphorylase / glucose-1-phosphate thymidylyltransferase / UDP-N-acetylgalactosamine diphosphorylase / glucosamine-1-phosphate N-acetyltransferase / galactosamine-1-phosphate N-acetyltransferase
MDAVILAAGEGTRLRPLTSTRSKPMLEVGGKTILEWDLDALAKNKFKKVVIIVGYKKEVIVKKIGPRFMGMKIEYVEQKEQLGTGHAVQMAEGRVKGEFLVMNGDLLITPKLIKDFIRNAEKKKAKNSMSLVEVADPTQFGIVEVSGTLVKKIIEKPSVPAGNLANAGIYLFNEEVFDMLKKVGKSERLEYELTDAIERLIPEEKIHAFKLTDRWIDIGRPWDLLLANESIVRNIKNFIDKKAVIEKYAVIKGPVHIGKGTVVRSGCYIVGPCFIGENCVLGPNCYIRPYTSIKDGVHIGNSVEIKNSIVMSNTKINHLTYVGDSIIGEGCNFGAGTNIANLRMDDAEIKIEVKDKLVKSGRKKFGCLMGDNVKTGINVSIMPGRSIYPNSYVEAGSVVRNTIYNEQ